MAEERERRSAQALESRSRAALAPGTDTRGNEDQTFRRGLRDGAERRAGLHRRAARPSQGGREGPGRPRRRDDRRDRPEARRADRRDPPPRRLPEARVRLARAEVPRRPDRFPREHQGRAAQRLEGRPAAGLRGLPRDHQVRALQARLHGRVRSVRRRALRRDDRQLRVRPGPAGHHAAAIRGQRGARWPTRRSSPSAGPQFFGAGLVPRDCRT